MKSLSLRRTIGAIQLMLCLSVVSAGGAIPVIITGGAFVMSFLFPSSGIAQNAGLNKEIWLPEIMEGFYADDMFLTEVRNMDAFVSNNTINLAEAGVNPDVIIDNTVYPIPVNQRTDTPIALPLRTFDTENTLVQSMETAELAYDKRASIIYGHRQSLQMKFMELAAHSYAPASNGTFTPLFETTGADDGTGRKKLKWSDLRKMQTLFDNAEIPQEGRISVLTATHLADLEDEDLERFNKVMDGKMIVCTFKIYKLAEKRLPRYNNSTGAKVAFGAVAAGTDSRASIFFHKDEVMRARGDMDMFVREKDPELRGDVAGFQMRGVALPIRNKGIGAIYSAAV